MLKLVRVALLAVVLGAGGVAFAAEDASQHQMIDQVLRDHPQSAKAHFVAAELDARIGDLDAARQQLAMAKQLDPSQSFTNANALSALQRQLTGMRAVIPRVSPESLAPPMRRSTVPWGWIIVLALGAFVAWSLFRGRAQRAAYAQANGYPPGTLPTSGYGPAYPPPGGSGLMGNLASGLAIGAGVAAGEELVRHVIDNSGGNAVPTAADLNDPGQVQDMGGADFGGDGGDGGDGGGGDWS